MIQLEGHLSELKFLRILCNSTECASETTIKV